MSIKSFFLTLISLCLASSIEAQSEGSLVLADSIVINAPDSAAYLEDIYFFKNHLVVRFNSIVNDSSFLYLAQKDEAPQKFQTPGRIPVDRFCNLFESGTGYVIPRYIDNNLTYLDKRSHLIIQDKAKDVTYQYKTGFFGGVNRVGVGNNLMDARNDAFYSDSMAIFHIQIPKAWVKNNNFKKWHKAIREYNILLKYDVQKERGIKVFGKYPNQYMDSLEYYAGNGRCFSAYTNQDIYLTFQGDSRIYKYDFNGLLLEEKQFPGKHIKKENLKFHEIIKGSFRFPDIYNGYLDSYGEIYNFGRYIFRKYNLALDSNVIKPYLIPADFKGCILAQTRLEWWFLLNKKPSYLQQIDFEKGTYKEFAYPSRMVGFVGFEEDKNLYYFVKENKWVRGEGVVIYGYRGN